MFNPVKGAVPPRHWRAAWLRIFPMLGSLCLEIFTFLFLSFWAPKRLLSMELRPGNLSNAAQRSPVAGAVSSIVNIDLSVAIWVLFFDSTISTATEKIVKAGGCDCAADQRRRAAGVELAVPEVYFCDV
jgi:hypothetical protein